MTATISGRTVTGVCWDQELGLEVSSRESFVEHIRSLIMGQSHYYWWHVAILLRLKAKYHCTTEKPARQPHACQPASFELSFRIHVTPNTKHQTSGFSQRQSIHPHQYQQHTPVSPQPPFIKYSINWSMKHVWINGSHDSGSEITRTLFFVVFVGNCYEFDIYSSYIKSIWINIASKKSF